MHFIQCRVCIGVLLACIFAQAQLGYCHLPELFGREFIRFEDSARQTLSATSSQKSLEASELAVPDQEDLLKYQQELDRVEISGGPYATGLTDPLISLARYHQARGDLDDAIDSYRRALHLIRVNDGLSSERQIPVLRALLGVYRTAGDHQALGDLYEYYFRVRKLGETPLTQESLEDSLEYYSWERDLYWARTDGLQREHLLRAYQANEQRIKDFVPTTTQETSWDLRLRMSQLRNLYLILGDDELSMSYVPGGEDMAADAVNRQISFIQKVAYSKGKKLLVASIERAQSSPPVDIAALHLELGDWLQWNGGFRQANEQYARVEQVLLAAGEEKLLVRWLGQPVELPDESDLWSIADGDLQSGSVVVDAHYGVTSRGDVRSLTTSVAEQEQEWQAWRIKRMLRDTHFRPRFSGGEPRAVDEVSRRYRLVEKR